MLEIACFEITSAETALASVADRIEFCSEQSQGGLTPNIDEFRYLKSLYQKPIYVMIRPTGGSFLYSETEFQQMKKDIIQFKEAGADGFVFGVLTSGNLVDTARNQELLTLAGDTPCTFHRAIDRTPDLEQSMETLIHLGFKGVLTSGGASTAMEGKAQLKKMVEQYANQIDIIVGGGVRSENITELQQSTNAKIFHSSAIPSYEIFANEEEIKKIRKGIV